MTDEPYRWLEAISQRREYVESRLLGGSPVLAASLREGLLLLGVGTGQSKVFEIFDRHALAGIGHPADLERLRQGVIDAAHLEGFTRAPEDVSLRRLVSFGIGPTIKSTFEQLFSPPFLARLILAEVGTTPAEDRIARVDFDGTFQFQNGGTCLVAEPAAVTAAAEAYLNRFLRPDTSVPDAAHLLLSAWVHITAGDSLPDRALPATRLREVIGSRVVEGALLSRHSTRPARYRALSDADLALPPSPPAP